MAELADAHGSGPCEGNLMQVQLLLSAQRPSEYSGGFIVHTVVHYGQINKKPNQFPKNVIHTG